MTFSAEHIFHVISIDRVVNIKQKIQILHSLRQEETLLSVLQTLVMDIMNCGVSTSEEKDN